MNELSKVVNFSRFFPDDNAYVNTQGKFTKLDDWSVNLSIQSGPRHSAEFWAAEWNHAEMREQLLALREAINQTLTFIDKCTGQKAV